MARVTEIDSLKKQIKQSKSVFEEAQQTQQSLEQVVASKDEEIDELKHKLENIATQNSLIGEN
jgi:uncharacterized protein YhaN